MTISARIVADSINENGKRITTFELEYPRFIHAELMTHRVFSRNAASSRAIPVTRAIELIQNDTAMPSHWGKNQPGMSAKEECYATFPVDLPILSEEGDFFFDIDGNLATKTVERSREDMWNIARDNAIEIAKLFNEAGYHKQIVNRLLEPFTHIKVVLTASEYDNWFWLRNHPDAQPEIHILAERMFAEYEASTPELLLAGEWHVPYYDKGYWKPSGYIKLDGQGSFDIIDGQRDGLGVSLADALAVSSSCSAQVSYRRLDDSVEKARDIFKRLVESLPPHFSPFEHQATPMSGQGFNQAGVTHMDKAGHYYSGNFQDWVQHRQLIMEELKIAPMNSMPPKE